MPVIQIPERMLARAGGISRFILPLPDFCQDIIYRRTLESWLEQHPVVSGSIVWETPTGPLVYADWPEEKKDQLRKAFPFGYPFQLEDPPPNMRNLADDEEPYTVLSEDHAWQLYLNHLTQSLASEFWHAFAWSLEDYPAENLAVMLDSRSFFEWSRPGGGYLLNMSVSGRALPAPPDLVYSFLSGNNLIAEDRLHTIGHVLNWCRHNLHHLSDGATARNMEYQWQYRGFPPVSRILTGTVNTNPAPGYTDSQLKHRTAGCHGTNGFLRAVLRIVNIPVLYLRPPGSGHATPSFPGEGMFLSHGDDPYSSLTKATPPYPAVDLLIDRTQFDAWFPPGASDPDKNIGRRAYELALIHLPDYLLHLRCSDIAAGRSHAQSDVYRVFQHLYSLAELEAMNLWGRLDEKVASFGGCSYIP
jgi:hypothetical protein